MSRSGMCSANGVSKEVMQQEFEKNGACVEFGGPFDLQMHGNSYNGSTYKVEDRFRNNPSPTPDRGIGSWNKPRFIRGPRKPSANHDTHGTHSDYVDPNQAKEIPEPAGAEQARAMSNANAKFDQYGNYPKDLSDVDVIVSGNVRYYDCETGRTLGVGQMTEGDAPGKYNFINAWEKIDSVNRSVAVKAIKAMRAVRKASSAQVTATTDEASQKSEAKHNFQTGHVQAEYEETDSGRTTVYTFNRRDSGVAPTTPTQQKAPSAPQPQVQQKRPGPPAGRKVR